MIRIVVEISAPTGQAIGIKEWLAMELERFGDCRVASVEEPTSDQTTFFALGRRP